MTSLSDLIERLEKATGADRELDALIYIQKYPESADDPGPSIGDHGWAFLRYGVVRDDVPHYTGSFDAARELIPDGLYWHAGEGKTRDDEPLGAAEIIEPGSLKTIADAEHAKVEIALCIASLKARMKVAG